MIKLSPSLLAADPLALEAAARAALDEGADMLHVDVMDGHFVPNLSFGPSVVRALRAHFPEAFLDVHLMLSEPVRYVDTFIASGASALTVHLEAEAPDLAIDMIRKAHLTAGLSVRPATPAEKLIPYFDRADLILIMTVEPGFGGQAFREDCARKIGALRQLGYRGMISVDGGVGPGNMELLRDQGVSMLVMGTSYFRAADRRDLVRRVHAL